MNPLWIDLDNAPQAVFFKPIIDGLTQRGIPVLLTAREVNDTPELARKLGLEPLVSGHAFGQNMVGKIVGTLKHGTSLARRVRSKKPVLAVSHGSRGQAIAARLLRVPTVLFFDYEIAQLGVFKSSPRQYYPALLDGVVRDSGQVRGEAGRPYPGLKEHLALLTREDNEAALREAGVPADRDFAVVRPESDTAHYLEGTDDSLLLAAIRRCLEWQLEVVLVPRSPAQRARLGEVCSHAELPVTIPNRAVNGMDLLDRAKVLVSGGGTMNREAAVLRLPCISIFRGKVGTLDGLLARDGAITHITTPEGFAALPAPPEAAPSAAGVDADPETLRDWIVDALVADHAEFAR